MTNKQRSIRQANQPKQKRGEETPVALPQGLATRDAAVHLLYTVLVRQVPLDAALDDAQKSTGRLAALEARDRAFARLIVFTALRRLGQIENVLSHFLIRGLPKERGKLREILIAGIAQLLFLDTPAHAVINLAVRQAKLDPKARRFDKLVNAVLRRAAREGGQICARQDTSVLNTPTWLWQRWSRANGVENARQIAVANMVEPTLDLTVKYDPIDWAAKLGGIALPNGTVRLSHRGRIEDLEGFAEGAWWVQDFASALPVQLLGNLVGCRVADLCAAPGGKSAQLIAAGADVTSLDRSGARLVRLKDNLKRLGLTSNLVEADATSWQTGESFDVVVLDAPCTALGTIRRHPDIPWLRSERDVTEMAKLQQRLLDHAVRLIRPGGRLLYCTCSLEPEEGSDQIAQLLNRQGDLRVVACEPKLVGGKAAWFTGQGALRTFPYFSAAVDDQTSGMDGFFASIVAKPS